MIATVSSGAKGSSQWANSVAAAVNPSAWVAVSFLNSWVDYGVGNQVCQYRITGDMVLVRGLMKSGTIGLAALTLPAGFRPPSAIMFVGNANGTFGPFQIDVAGVLTPLSGSNVYFSICCTFSTTA